MYAEDILLKIFLVCLAIFGIIFSISAGLSLGVKMIKAAAGG